MSTLHMTSIARQAPAAPARAGVPTTAASYAADRAYVLAVLARRCGWLAADEREAVFHDAYVVLLEKQASGRLDTSVMHPSQLRAYLVQTALNKACDVRKRSSRRQLVALDGEATELPATEASPDAEVLERAERGQVRSLVRALPERQQRVIALRYFAEQEPDEVQAEMAISSRVYRRELERAKRRLREEYTAVAA